MTSPSLGDFFPKTIREEFSERNLCPGTVLKTFVHDTKPPKIKFFVVLATDQGSLAVACLYINTEINVNVFPTQALRDLHLPLRSGEYEFLGHDSYLDCSDIREKEYEAIKSTLTGDPSVLYGKLTQADLDSALRIVGSAETIKPKLRKKYNLA